ncbi:MAG: alpha/beta fold hydrolase [Rhizobiaceae bacterium]|nr:alpha/beta fold hydrolase [Rhizobiaceae bacterium]
MVSLNVMRWGERNAARTVVALHGITANAGAMTEPARLLAARGWAFTAADMRGHGESSRGDGDFSFDSLLADFGENLPLEPDVLIGHSFGGTLAQLGVLKGILRPKSLLLEDPVSHFADKATPKAMLDWDEANLPHDIEGLLKLNPGWSRRDAAWKLVSLQQLDFNDARAAFSGNAPWDLRARAKEIADRLPTVWVLPAQSRFVPPEDTERLIREVGARNIVVMPGAGHSIHRDATETFVDIVEKLGTGTWFA